VPFNSKTDKFETLLKILIHDSARNKLILEDVKTELIVGKKVVIITERKEHINSLYQYLKQSYEAITLNGEDSESSRTTKWKILKDGNYQVLITTGQFFGEGTDLQNANCLFLVYPFSFEGKLIQYIGRVQRSEVTPTIYDYWDIKIDYLNKLFLKRNTYYRKIDKQATLFDEPIEVEKAIIDSKRVFTIEKAIKIPFEKLDFRYGSIAFKYDIAEINTEVEFEIENLEIRPELEVLKPYFSKMLKLKNVAIAIQAEFENEKLMSQLATSTDLERINNEIIESVKFSFISKDILVKPKTDTKLNLLDIAQIQDFRHGESSLYGSGEELLEDILKGKNFKHRKQLMYLAQKHDSQTLKIRFVLSPFSFVFLLTGEEQFHIVLETLETEEATYVWHLPKNVETLKVKLKEIDQQLSIMKNKGRQIFLETQPSNFNRILHDYSDDRKGFIIWKDLLEELIF
jgi:ribosomal silencing factor RsfS